MKVDREIVFLTPQPPDECDVGEEAASRMWTVRHDHVVEMRIVAHDRLGFRFDDVGDARVWVVAAEGSNGRRREYDITDQPEPD
jgi:hypothetical protein